MVQTCCDCTIQQQGTAGQSLSALDGITGAAQDLTGIPAVGDMTHMSSETRCGQEQLTAQDSLHIRSVAAQRRRVTNSDLLFVVPACMLMHPSVPVARHNYRTTYDDDGSALAPDASGMTGSGSSQARRGEIAYLT